jgi:tetratricopeptide (TPR) repeat protein
VTPEEREERIRALAQESGRWRTSDLHRHAAIAAEVMKLAEGAGPGAQALALRVLGNNLRLEGRLPEALTSLRRSLRMAQIAGWEIEWARTKIAILPVLVQLGRHRAATRAAEEGLAIFLRHEEWLMAARLLHNSAAVYFNMGRPMDALGSLTRGEELAARTPDQGLRARMTLTRALVLQQLGRHGESIAACARALRHALHSDERLFAARVLQAGAVALVHLGRFGRALRRFSKARDLFAQVGSGRDVAVCDLYLCHCYVELNRYDQALARVQAVLTDPQVPLSGFQQASARLYEGIALSRLRRREEALTALSGACQWFERHGHAPWAGRGSLEEAQLQIARGDARAATRAAARAGRLFRTAQMPVEQARAALLEAEAYLLERRLSQAERVATGAYDTFRRARMPGPVFRCLQVLGRSALARRDREAARRWLTRAIRTAEQMRAAVQISFRQSFMDDKAGTYADLVWLDLTEGRVEAAHRLADRAKSRALVDRLASLNLRRRDPGADSAADRVLWAAMEGARRQYQELMLPAQLGPEEAVMLSGGAGSLTARRTQAEARLTSLWDEWELRQTAHTGIAQRGAGGADLRLRDCLPAQACLVEFFVAGIHTVAFVSDRRGLRGWVDLGAPEPVRRALELLQLNLDAALGSVGLPEPPGLPRNARALLTGIYRRLWEPLLPLLGACRQVVIIPHGILHQIPFEALHDGEHYLVEQLELSLAPSREAWTLCCNRTCGPAPDLVAGYDAGGQLPYVPEEARWVAAALRTEPWLNGEATGGRLAAAGNRRVVHLAVHGEFRPDNPNFSTLLLADGPLVAADAARLRLNAELVVLSGCETGLSQITPGEELQGMISAVLLAGTASVVASRWRVDDRITAALMQQLYAGLLAGRGKAAALREAQAAMAAQGIHPLYWAAFYLVGDTRPLSPSQH